LLELEAGIMQELREGGRGASQLEAAQSLSPWTFSPSLNFPKFIPALLFLMKGEVF
jgi:hypothetical protein